MVTKLSRYGQNEIQILEIIKDIALGLYEMHMKKPPLAHRDLKLDNVLLGQDGKIGDISITLLPSG